jgi:hypothetical protein
MHLFDAASVQNLKLALRQAVTAPDALHLRYRIEQAHQ